MLFSVKVGESQINIVTELGDNGEVVASLTGPDRMKWASLFTASEVICRLHAQQEQFRQNAIRLVAAVDALDDDGDVKIPYTEGLELAVATDAVRVSLGNPSKLSGDADHRERVAELLKRHKDRREQ